MNIITDAVDTCVRFARGVSFQDLAALLCGVVLVVAIDAFFREVRRAW